MQVGKGEKLDRNVVWTMYIVDAMEIAISDAVEN